MILVIGRYNIDPAHREGFLVFARQLVKHERQQPGCLVFDIFEDVMTPNAFMMMEQWESEEALDAHSETEAFAQGEAALNGFIMGEPSWDEYQF